MCFQRTLRNLEKKYVIYPVYTKNYLSSVLPGLPISPCFMDITGLQRDINRTSGSKIYILLELVIIILCFQAYVSVRVVSLSGQLCHIICDNCVKCSVICVCMCIIF